MHGAVRQPITADLPGLDDADAGAWAHAACMQNQFDSIDLSDNAIVKIEGFPRLLRLKQLLLNNNRISRIAKQLEGVHTLHATGLLALHDGPAR